MVNHDGTGIYCSCHECELMAKLKPREGLEIKDGRHGTKHVAHVGPDEILVRLAGTGTREGVLTYVKSVIGGLP